MDKDQDIRQLFERYIARSCTDAELDKLLAYLENGTDDDLQALISAEMQKETDESEDDQIIAITQNAERRIFAKTRPRPFYLSTFVKVSIAAALLLGLAVFLILNSRTSRNVKTFSDGEISVLAGTEKAMLFLSDGRKIPLGKTADLNLAVEDGTKIALEKEGKISYQGSSRQIARNASNMLEVPRGGQFSVTLSDGTKVWLNAGSRLKYPVMFAGSGNRIVELSGEAYFEVAKDSSRPFVVNTQRQSIEVLGTHFNINSYNDESRAVTTLSEGSVRVREASKSNASHILKPGQMAVTDKQGTLVAKADMETAMAWRKGMIYFRNAPLSEIMRQVSRWYDIEIVYKGQMQNRSFTGGVYRSADLSELLKILMLNDIHFTLIENQKNRKLIVEP